MDAENPSPFPYEDALESSIQSLIALNNRYDSTGKLNDLLVPPRRVQQSLHRPKWYSPSLHASSPYLSASIAQPSSILTPGVPFTLTITLYHHPSPTGNPSSQPITFQLQDTHLNTIGPVEFYPWLLLHHDPNALEGGLKEIEGDNSEGHGPAVPWEDLAHAAGLELSEEREQPPLVSRDNGFVSLAVGETMTIKVDFRPEQDLIEDEGRYELCFRGTRIEWWRFGSVEELEVGGVRKDDEGTVEERLNRSIIVPCSNLMEFLVRG